MTTSETNAIIQLSLDIWHETGLLKSARHPDGMLAYSDMVPKQLFHFFVPAFDVTDLSQKTLGHVREFYQARHFTPALYVPDDMVSRLPVKADDVLMNEVVMSAPCLGVLALLDNKEAANLQLIRTRNFKDPQYLDVYNKVFLSADGSSEYDEIYHAFPKLYQSALDGHASFKPWIMRGTLDNAPATSVTMIPKGNLVGLYNLATRDEFRGQGLARATIHKAVKTAYMEGANTVFLVTDSNSELENTYTRMGFKPIARYTGFTFT